MRFLAAQYSERDGVEQPLFAGCFGIFGHGNVAGVGQALLEAELPEPGRTLPLRTTGPQRAGDGARRGRLRPDAQPAVRPSPAPPRSAPARPTWSPAPRWPPSTGCRCCCCPATSSPPGSPARCCRSWRTPRRLRRHASTTRSGRCRGSSTGSAGPSSCRPRCSARCGCSPTRRRPARSRSRCRRTCRPRRTTGRRSCSPSGSGTSRRPAPEPAALARAVEVIRARGGRSIVAGGGVIYSEATEALRAFAEATGIPVAETQAGKGALPLRPPAVGRRDRRDRHHRRQRAGPRGRRGDRRRHPLQRLHHRLADRVRATRTCGSSTSTWPRFDARQARRRPRVVADARAALEALTDGAGRLAGPDRSTASGPPARRASGTRPSTRAYDLGHGPLPAQSEVIGAVNDGVADRGTWWSARPARMPGDLHKLWRTRDPKGYHVEYGYSCMGYEIAGGARREDGRSATGETARSSSWSATART